MTDTSARTRGRRVLVTHDRLAENAIELLNAHDVDVFFSPAYAPSEQVAQRAAELQVDALIVRQGRVDEAIISASPRLKVIAKHGVGVDNIDLQAAASRNIPVIRAMGSNSRAVAEHTIALALTLLKEIPRLDSAVKAGSWPKPSFIGRDIAGTVIGLVGFGSIGQHVARMASGLGMTVILHDPHARQAIAQFGAGCERDLDSLIREADIISLHCPLTNATRNLLDERRFGLMKPSSFVVNTARGALIDEAALCAALLEGKIAGAALDSFAVEPPAKDSPLWAMPNLITTPHIAGVTAGSAKAMAEIAARHVIAVLDGEAPDEGSLARLTELAA
ncbi:hydroxyacid dehydrogenase [Bosea thiooxidans]|uniref:D-3-phosphoglycerate dehydrogenase n=1 Tax=Bosea thiooxidans TaxID=53254 RepID=A0A0Q3PQW5_9HYPH|nr:hydroxyacid dehydrogenase [Bosea thiooxidans]KQK32238.1 hydroxyacid dehydrogenase [Bosea thiooxidans]SKC10282.1 D-3-phosphoglycerate dehydrogenase [Bosea thiooxidans]